jgi:hypothetical protein
VTRKEVELNPFVSTFLCLVQERVRIRQEVAVILNRLKQKSISHERGVNVPLQADLGRFDGILPLWGCTEPNTMYVNPCGRGRISERP